MNNTLDELIETNATFYDKKEPVRKDILVNKTNNGWRKEKVTRVPEQTGKEHSINKDTQPKRVNNKHGTRESVMMTRSNWIGRKIDGLL